MILEFQVGCQASFWLACLMPFKPHRVNGLHQGVKLFLQGTIGRHRSCQWVDRFQAGETQASAPPTGGWAKCVTQRKMNKIDPEHRNVEQTNQFQRVGGVRDVGRD